VHNPRFMYGTSPRTWEIAAYHGVNRWHMLGTIDGSNPQSALESWVKEQGGIRPGWYGVRSGDQADWQPFRVDKTGVRRVQTRSPIG
jgi:hypothetical protein